MYTSPGCTSLLWWPSSSERSSWFASTGVPDLSASAKPSAVKVAPDCIPTCPYNTYRHSTHELSEDEFVAWMVEEYGSAPSCRTRLGRWCCVCRPQLVSP